MNLNNVSGPTEPNLDLNPLGKDPVSPSSTPAAKSPSLKKMPSLEALNQPEGTAATLDNVHIHKFPSEEEVAEALADYPPRAPGTDKSEQPQRLERTPQLAIVAVKKRSKYMRKIEAKASSAVESTLGTLDNFGIKVTATMLILLGLRTKSVRQAVVALFSDRYQPRPRALKNVAEASHAKESKKVYVEKDFAEQIKELESCMLPSTENFLVDVRTRLISSRALEALKEDHPVDLQAENSVSGLQAHVVAGQESSGEAEMEGSLFQAALTDLAERGHSTTVHSVQDVVDFTRVEAMIASIINQTTADQEQVAEESSSFQGATELEERARMEELMALGRELITDELVAHFVLQEGFAKYCGNLDEDYAQEVLTRLPATSALLFSERDEHDELVFVVAALDAQRNLKLYEYSNLPEGFDFVVKDLKASFGLELVDYQNIGNLVEKRWVRTVPTEDEGAISGERKNFLSSARDVFKSNKAIAESSTYFLGQGSDEDAEKEFKRLKSPVGTALLRYDGGQGSFFISSIINDEHNHAVIVHKRVLDVEKSMKEHQDFSFIGNGLKAQDFLGKRKSYYCGEMDDAQAADYLRGVAPERYAMIYSKTMPDGRMVFFAGINKLQVDEQGQKKVTFVPYEIGIRPEGDAFWVSFFAANHASDFIVPKTIETAKKLNEELKNSLYNHGSIGISEAEKRLHMATVGTMILHTIDEGENTKNVFSVKLSNHVVHHTLPNDPAALPASFVDLQYKLLKKQTIEELPSSFNELNSKLHDEKFIFAPSQEPSKTYSDQARALVAGIKARLVSRNKQSPFKNSDDSNLRD